MDIFNHDFDVIYIRVVQGCNLNCTHCFTLGNTDPILLTDIENIDQFLKPIAEHIAPKKATFYIHGGETFLAPLDYLKTVNDLIRKYYKETQINIIPQTNLVYKITPEYIDFLKREYNGTVGVSWDADIRFGSTTKNGKQQEALFFKNVKTLLDHNISVHVAISTTRHLLKYDPIDLVSKFDGVDSIDFELLTVFDEKTKDLKPDNKLWSDWLDTLVEYYQNGNTTWCLPQIDLFVKQMATGEIVNCKCNCCDKRTFTLNPNGSVGLCPDMTYINPISTIDELNNDWETFQSKALDVIIDKIDNQQMHDMCYTCEHYELCGGNCEADLFDETDECPLSRKVITRIRDNINIFTNLYNNKAKMQLTELREDYNEKT